MIKYCLPIVGESKEEILQMISENPDYDFYEIWLSNIGDLNTDFVWKISDQFNGKLIFHFRKQNLEKTDLDKETKEKIIKLLENSENFLDLDINDQKEELEFIKQEELNNKLIVSYHNYKETPEMEELGKISEDMDSRFLGNDKEIIFKVSTFCKDPQDAVKLLTLLLQLNKRNKNFIAKQEDAVTEKSRRFIVLGMGDEGKIVRIYGALWGNEFNFAPVDENEKSAPGQLTREKLEKILNLLDPALSAG